MTTRSPPYTSACDTVPALPSAAEILARAAGENFRVASRLLPAATREHLLALYGYARLVDQLGDAYTGDRLAALEGVATQVERAWADPGAAGLNPLVARAVGAARRVRGDAEPLLDLVRANVADQTVHRYETFADLLGYCRLSANPVGRLVLDALGAATPERQAWSDSICSGLQLAEHWQDVAEDATAGRVYLPAEDLRRFGVDESELTAAPPASRELRALMAFEVARARRLLDEGVPLVASLAGRPRVAVAGFVAGGHGALDAIAARGFDPLAGAPRPSRRRVAVRMGSLLRSSLARRGAA